jgi:hypothetical protein
MISKLKTHFLIQHHGRRPCIVFSDTRNHSIVNSLATYCEDMKLIINLDKTQAIIFSKGNVQHNRLTNFTYNDNKIEFCKSYKYLGVEFQQNGKFKEVIKTRILKAQHAIYA